MISDTLTVIGLAAVAAGFALAWPPLGLIVAGAALVLIGIGDLRDR